MSRGALDPGWLEEGKALLLAKFPGALGAPARARSGTSGVVRRFLDASARAIEVELAFDVPPTLLGVYRPMSRVPWKEGKVISIETRPGVFALGQMLVEPYMAFFDVFGESADWPDTNLEEVKILHVAGVVRQFLTASNSKYQKHITPVEVDYPKRWIATDAEPVFRTVWTGSSHQMTVGYTGTKASLIERDIAATSFDDSIESERTIKGKISPDDMSTIERYEIDNLVAHPYQNERLYLCHLLGKNVDVEKYLVFRKELPIEFETYLRHLALTEDQVADLKPGSIEVDPKMPRNRKPFSELKQRKTKS